VVVEMAVAALALKALVALKETWVTLVLMALQGPRVRVVRRVCKVLKD
jgi:hypothetical protein